MLLWLALAGLGACGDRVRDPAIGFTYNWGDTTLETAVRAELALRADAGESPTRLIATDSGGWAAYGTTPLTAEVQRATRLAANPEIVVVVGPGGSREALQVAPVYGAAEMPLLIPTATSRLLAGAGELTFRLAPDDSVQGEFIAAFADSALRVRRLAIFYVPDEYGIGLAAGAASAASARGIELLERAPIRLTQDCLSDAGRQHYDGIVEQLARRGTPDGVVIAARTVEAACLARPLRLRWPGVELLAGDGVYLESGYFLRAGDASQNTYLVAFWHPDLPSAASRAFRDRFVAQTGRIPRHGDAVFADAALLADAAIRDGGASRAAVAAYLRSLGRTRPPYEGITGPIAFSPTHIRPLLMTRVVGEGSQLAARR
jgi:ABC-type branched-subunit amino acid transport system substrate-binding protein